MNPYLFLDFIYNKNLPDIYKVYDNEKFEFKKYIEALYEGGFLTVINGENELINLIDPILCPEKALPLFCNSFGLNYYPDIPPKYHRKLLANIGELNRRRGSYYCIRFLCRVLTGKEVDFEYDYTTEPDYEGFKVLLIDLIVETLIDATNLVEDIKAVKAFIPDFIPYFIPATLITSIIDEWLITVPLSKVTFMTIQREITSPLEYEFTILNNWDNLNLKTWGYLVSKTWSDVLMNRY